MQRRKFITGLGALVTGSAAAIGSGAYSSVEANRSVTVNTADDASAYLRLTAGDTDYVTDDSGSGQLNIDLGGPTVQDDDGNSEGEGFNENAITFVHNVVVVENQGNKTVDVSFLDDSDSSVSERELTVDAGKATFSFDGSTELDPGQQVHIDVEVDTTVPGDSDGATLTIMADSV